MAADWVEKIEDITREGNPDQLLTKYDVAALLKVAPITVTRMGAAGKIPRIKINDKMIRYRLGDVRQFIRERTEL